MKITRLVLASALFLTAASFTFAGPGAQYFQQRRAERTGAAVEVSKPAMDCPHCKVVTVSRPIASGKATMRSQRVECSGCDRMAAGEKC